MGEKTMLKKITRKKMNLRRTLKKPPLPPGKILRRTNIKTKRDKWYDKYIFLMFGYTDKFYFMRNINFPTISEILTVIEHQ